jgi:hypothetical protein
MSKKKYSQIRKWEIKIRSWEYWPLYILYIPLSFYACWLAIKARSLTFFTSVNPLIPASGLLGASKFDVLSHLPAQWTPTTIKVFEPDSITDPTSFLRTHNLTFPLIIKPDKAERGVGVHLIQDLSQMKDVIQKSEYDLVIQSYIEYPYEYGVFYIRMPFDPGGRIISVVKKEFLTVVGDGSSTVAELMSIEDRSYLILEKWLEKKVPLLDYVPKRQEKVLLEPIGNHNRGTKFIDGNHLINSQMDATFSRICGHIPEFYYGRLDIKCADESDLYTGNNLKIMEVNGVNSEPAHIYDPSSSYWIGLKTVLKLWSIIYKISQQNRKRGFRPSSVGSIYRAYEERKKAIQS